MLLKQLETAPIAQKVSILTEAIRDRANWTVTYQGKTILWWAFLMTVQGKPDPLNMILEANNNSLKGFDLNVKAESGLFIGNSLLMFAFARASNGNNELLDKILQANHNNLCGLDLNAKSESRAYKGYTILWWALLAAVKGNYAPLDKLLESNNNTLDGFELKAKVENGDYRGISILWYAFAAAANGNNKALDKILEANHNNLRGFDLNAKALKLNKGKNILYLAANSASLGNSKPLDKLLEANDNSLRNLDLKAKSEDGHTKGKSTLWWAFAMAADGRPELLNKILEVSPKGLNGYELNAKAEGGMFHGCSILWWAFLAATYNISEPLEHLLAANNNSLNGFDLKVKPESTPFKGQSLIWLAFAAWDNYETPLEKLLEASHNSLKDFDLHTKAETGKHKGKSILWWAFENASLEDSRPLTKLLDAKNNSLKEFDLKAKAEDGDCKGQSLLWLAMCIMYKYSQVPFKLMLEAKHNNLAEFDLTAKAEDGEDEGLSIFMLTLFAAQRNYKSYDLELLLSAFHEDTIWSSYVDENFSLTEKLLSYCQNFEAYGWIVSRILPRLPFHKIASASQCQQDSLLPTDVVNILLPGLDFNLSDAHYNEIRFFAYMSYLQYVFGKEEKPNQNVLESISRHLNSILSKFTHTSRNNHAYFLLGKLYESIDQESACKYYKSIDKAYPFYQQVQFFLASYYYSKISENSNRHYWIQAAKYAYRSGEKTFFTRIAASYCGIGTLSKHDISPLITSSYPMSEEDIEIYLNCIHQAYKAMQKPTQEPVEIAHHTPGFFPRINKPLSTENNTSFSNDTTNKRQLDKENNHEQCEKKQRLR